jgi:hypothetical protein
MERRLEQVARMPKAADRFQGYAATVKSAFLFPNYTELGFGIARAPNDLTVALQKGIADGISTASVGEPLLAFFGPTPLHIERPDLQERVSRELAHYAESWCQMPLVLHRVNGFRVYRNDSQLMMHLDAPQSNVINIIYHIDSSKDAEPWPLMVEDYLGRTHEVILTPADILFLESAKVPHGRPAKFNGSWYTSLFLEYYPADGWANRDHVQESVFAVPPTWVQDPDPASPSSYPRMEMLHTGYMEPDCANYWCPSTIKWSGPGKDGVWIDPLFREHPFHPKPLAAHTEL